MGKFWKEDWDIAKQHFIKWWNIEGPAISVMSPKDKPWAELPPPERELPFCQPNAPKAPKAAKDRKTIPVPKDPAQMWLDPKLRFRAAEYQIANTFYGGEAFPCYDPHLGPGNLAAFLGAKPFFSETDAWFTASMNDINNPINFDENNEWFRRQMDLIEYGAKHAMERFLVAFPLLSENLDILAHLRSATNILMDIALEPDAGKKRVTEINEAFRRSAEKIFAAIKDDKGGNWYSTFDIWAPGRTAVIECDLSSMFSADMYTDIVLPALIEQCEHLDYIMYHLDGSQCLQHLDYILSIEKLRIVQWTPDSGQPGGGDPKWYPMYKKIKEAGKGVQAIWIKPEEIDPLFNAIGPEGVFLQIRAKTESDARRILDRCAKWYR